MRGRPWRHHHRGHWPEKLRHYWGAHLHRRLFLWFGAAIFLTTLTVGALVHLTGGPPVRRPLRGLLLFGVPALVLWTASGKIARRIARPLGALVRVSEEVGRGNLRARADLSCVGIGEIAVLSRSINEMAARIERQLQDQRELLAAVSHELRTPLGHLRILLELARDGRQDGKTLDEMEREVQEIDALVGELLASARLDFQALTPRPLDAGEMARRALERAGLAPELLTMETAGTALEADPTLLQRALANLLDNARKHGGGVERLRVRARPGFIAFDVDDRGPGFGSASPADGSLGLGLKLVRRIAQAHAGSLATLDRPEGGGRATLELAITPPVPSPRTAGRGPG